MNTHGLTLSGFREEDLLGRDLSLLLPGFEEIRDRLQHFPEYQEQLAETCLACRDGAQITLEVSLATMPDPKGGPGMLIMGRDIAERLRAENEKQELEQRLWQSRKMESIGLMAGGTAHDFNNIMSIIFNYTDLSMGLMGKDHPAGRYLKQVISAANQAVDLARKLYTIGREDRHETHPVDMGGLMGETLKLIRLSMGKELTLDFQSGDRPLMVMGEETRLRQVLMNLITNASHAMDFRGKISLGGEAVQLEKGEEATAVEIPPGNYIRFWVRDSGPGIDSDVLPRIFEPYYSTKKGRNNAGLGLAVVHGIVRNYGGGVSVSSEPGKGTCFRIYLPEMKPGEMKPDENPLTFTDQPD